MQVITKGTVKITKAVITDTWRERAEGTRLIVRDRECRGLALIVNPTAMSWVYSYKPRGHDDQGKRFSTRSVTIGNPETHSVDEARAEASAIKGRVKVGGDPGAERKAEIKSKAVARGRTASKLLAEYEIALPKRPKLRGNGRLSDRHIASELAFARAAIESCGLGDRPVTDIGPTDIRAIVAAAASRPAVARHWFGAVSRFFDWLLDEGLVLANPSTLLPKSRRPRGVQQRQTYQTPSQLAALWRAGDNLDETRRDLFRLLIAIPVRRDEAAKVDWSQIDLKEAIWTMSHKRTKNGDAHRIFLPDLALILLTHRFFVAGKPDSGLVFPGPRAGQPIKTFTDLKKKISAAAPKVKGWTYHDFRRGFVTALGERGLSETLVDSILNHRQSATRGGVLGVYQKSLRWPEQVDAMKKWGGLLEEEISRGDNEEGKDGQS
jgi:integrase